MNIFTSPNREYLVAGIFALGPTWWITRPAALVCAIIPLLGAWKGVKERRVTIEACNFFALLASFADLVL